MGHQTTWTPDRKGIPLGLEKKGAHVYSAAVADGILIIGLTFVDSVTDVAPPPPLVDKVDKGVDVGAALPAPDDRLTLDDREVGQVSERVDQHTQGESAFLKQSVSLGDLKTSKDCKKACLHTNLPKSNKIEKMTSTRKIVKRLGG